MNEQQLFRSIHCMTCQEVHVHACFPVHFKVQVSANIGDREVLDYSLAEQNSNNDQQLGDNVRDAAEEGAGPVEARVPQAVAGPSSSAAARPEGQQQDLDSLIARMQRDMDQRLARGSVEDPPFSPPHEPERQADGSHSSNTFLSALF